MSDGTKIEWSDATWNPITGCSVVSPGCTNCYAMRLAGTRLQHHPSRAGLTDASKAGPVWNGRVRLNGQWIGQPLRWKKPRKIFVCAHGDLFHENVQDEWIFYTFAAMAMTYDVFKTNAAHVITERKQRHVYQVLTKRPDRMRAVMKKFLLQDTAIGADFLDHPFSRMSQFLSRQSGDLVWMNKPLETWKWVEDGCPGLWLGVSVEDQERANERIPLLLTTPAAVRFVSAEPLLGPVDLPNLPHWVIVGGESGPNARPMATDWARSIRDQCAAAGVPFFMKQMAKKAPIPDDLMIREYPKSYRAV